MKNKFTQTQNFQLFAIVSVPVHVWLYYFWFYSVSYVSLTADPGDQLAILGYSMMVGLVESAVLFVLVGLAANVGRRVWGPETALVRVMVLMWAMAGWFLLKPRTDFQNIDPLSGTLHIFDGLVARGWQTFWTAWIALWSLSVGGSVLAVVWLPRVEVWLAKTIAPGLGTLLKLYLWVDGMILMFIIFRNI